MKPKPMKTNDSKKGSKDFAPPLFHKWSGGAFPKQEQARYEDVEREKAFRDTQWYPVAVPSGVSLELLANTAAKLLRGKNYSKAAHEALLLLRACADLLVFNDEHGKSHERIERQVESLELAETEYISFDRGIKLITGQPRIDRASERFTNFMTATAADPENELSRRKTVGFKSREVPQMIELFKNWREKTPRTKKVLDSTPAKKTASKRPKAATTANRAARRSGNA